jgi:hypothetical protein
MLHGADARTEPACELERRAAEADEHRVVVDKGERLAHRLLAWPFQLHHHADSASAELEHLGE